jgi:hypothetical protein
VLFASHPIRDVSEVEIRNSMLAQSQQMRRVHD